MAEIKGDLIVRRTGVFDRRADQALINPAALSAARTLIRHSHYWQRLTTDDLGVQDVNLPDATTLPESWSVVIDNYGTTDNIEVKDNGTGLQKAIGPGEACMLILVDGTTAAGVWRVHCLTDPTADPPPRFVKDFVIADWSAASGGYHYIDCVEAGGGGHGRGANPIFQIHEKSGADHIKVELDREMLLANGDVEMRVTAGDSEDTDTDERFDGRIILI